MANYSNNKIKSSPFLRRPENIKKAVLLCSCIALVLMLAAGITSAFILDKTPPAQNEFVNAQVSCDVLENFDGVNKTVVRIKNTGDTSAYIRAAVVATWVKTDAEGNTVTHSKVPRLGEDFIIDEGDGDSMDYISNNNWIKGADGFWYYKNYVNVGAETGILINNCYAVTPKLADAPEGYNLSVEVVASAIQATPQKAVIQAWDSSVASVNQDGTLVITPYSKGDAE